MRSLSEIDTLSKRASKGIGFSWGVSEEIGKSIKLMEMFGLPGLKNLNKYFKVIKKSQFQNISLITETNISNKMQTYFFEQKRNAKSDVFKHMVYVELFTQNKVVENVKLYRNS